MKKIGAVLAGLGMVLLWIRMFGATDRSVVGFAGGLLFLAGLVIVLRTRRGRASS